MKKYYSYENMNLHLCRVDSSSKKTKISLPDKLVQYMTSLFTPSDEEGNPEKLIKHFLRGDYSFEIHYTTLGLLVRQIKDVKQELEDTKALRDTYTYFNELTGLDLVVGIENVYDCSTAVISIGELYHELESTDLHTSFHNDEYIFALSFRDNVLFLKDLASDVTTDIFNAFKYRMRSYPSAMSDVYTVHFKKSVHEKYLLYEQVGPKEFFLWDNNAYCKVNKTYAFNTKTGESFMADIRRHCYNRKMQPDHIWVTYLGKISWLGQWYDMPNTEE